MSPVSSHIVLPARRLDPWFTRRVYGCVRDPEGPDGCSSTPTTLGFADYDSDPHTSTVKAFVWSDASDAAGWQEQWDELARANSLPYSAPAWMLAWWKHAKPEGAILRIIATVEDDRLEGVLPLFAQRGPLGSYTYRLLGSGTSGRIEPLARRGREEVVGTTAVAALAELTPFPSAVSLEGIPVGSAWPDLLRRLWPKSRPVLLTGIHIPAPTLQLDGTFEDWWTSRSRNFREQMRRHRRKLDAAGATFRMSRGDDVARDLASFERLHRARWDERGGSQVLAAGTAAMLIEVARAWDRDDRFRLWVIDVDGETVSAQLFVAAGDLVSYWLGGFDDAWSRHQPALQAILTAIEDSWTRGEKRVDLGGGGQSYKYRFANGEDSLAWLTLVPRGSSLPMALAQMAPGLARSFASRRLPDEWKERLKKVLRNEPRSKDGVPDSDRDRTLANVQLYQDWEPESLQPAEKHTIANHLRPRMRVLDLGSGSGRVTAGLRNAGMDVVACDLSLSALQRLSERLGPDVPAVTGDARRLPFTDGSFEGVMFSYNGLDFLHPEGERERAITDIARVLRDDGIFIFSSHNPWGTLLSPHNMQSPATWRWRARLARHKAWRARYVYDQEGLYLYQAKPQEITAEVERLTGMECVDVLTYGGKNHSFIARWFSEWNYYVFRKVRPRRAPITAETI